MTKGLPLIRGGAEEQETVQRLITAVIICAVLIIVAAPLVTWITGFDKVKVKIGGKNKQVWTDNPDNTIANSPYDSEAELETALPHGFTTIFDKIILALRGIAAFAMIIALVWGGIELRGKPKLYPY